MEIRPENENLEERLHRGLDFAELATELGVFPETPNERLYAARVIDIL